MRLGFFLGFLIGAAIASLVSLSESEEPSDGAGPLEQVKRKAREAREAARQEAAAKEAAMMRDWEETRHREP
ncbi:MAG TPA: hypothetical protein VIB47_05645 [Dehalococcoidia bacterium]|jgi:hypothetical protein